MGFLQNFGSKVGSALNFGRKVVGKGLAFGAKVATGVAKAADWATEHGGNILSAAEGIVPGLRTVSSPLRAGLAAAKTVSGYAKELSGVFKAGALLTGNREGLEKQS